MMDYLRMDTRIHRGEIEIRFLEPDRGKKKGRATLTKWRHCAWYPPQNKSYAAEFAGEVARRHVEALILDYEIRFERWLKKKIKAGDL